MKTLFVLLASALVHSSEVELTAANYQSVVVDSAEVFMVEFSSKMCKTMKKH
jgi:hypothetical protein